MRRVLLGVGLLLLILSVWKGTFPPRAWSMSSRRPEDLKPLKRKGKVGELPDEPIPYRKTAGLSGPSLAPKNRPSSDIENDILGFQGNRNPGIEPIELEIERVPQSDPNAPEQWRLKNLDPNAPAAAQFKQGQVISTDELPPGNAQAHSFNEPSAAVESANPEPAPSGH